jgi:hypothetical protein
LSIGRFGARDKVETLALFFERDFSLFENHFDQTPIGFTPVDGTGNGNSFVADSNGSGFVSIIAPTQMTHANAVLVVYHSDNQTHGSERGAIGETAHHQLIARLP